MTRTLAISREELVRRLAEVSHLSYVRQKNRDHGVPLAELSLDVTDHDRERAQDIVAELERLGVYRAEPGVRQQPDTESPPQPEPPEPPQPQPQRKTVTDLWGNPITGRKRRRL
jgi:hypothetical protein